MALLTVAEAHARILALVAPLGIEDVPLAAAAGRTLARDVVATRDQPPFDASAMDGYAVRAEDARPGARLTVTAVSAAGHGYTGDIRSGEAIRIFTGAPVPAGAAHVVIQENVDRLGDVIEIRDPGTETAIRPAGNDFARGARIAAPRRLSPADIALLAAMNCCRVPCRRRPSVALIATGDELVIPGEDPACDQIISSNAYGLKGLLDAAGASARLLPIARDTPESLATTLALAADADLIVTLGGASVGDHDLVGTVDGLDVAFHRVALRPGKPLIAGRYDGIPFVGLPGNPVSAMVCGHLFLRPAVARLLGFDGALEASFPARLGTDLGPNGGRTHYMRAVTRPAPEGWVCTPFLRQDSSLLSILADANALLVRPPDDPARVVGDEVDFLWL